MIFLVTYVKGREYYIIPSTSFSCHSEEKMCFTFENFVDNASEYVKTNTTLTFSHGNHTLDSVVKIINSSEFIMHSNFMNTWINCNGTGSFTFINVTVVRIINLFFLGCGDNTLQEISQLSVHKSVFHGNNSYYNTGTALFIIYSNADITNTTFTVNTGTSNYPVDESLLQGDKYKVVGGAITSYGSSLWISECEFDGNTAELGGALFIEETVISISSSVFERNLAYPYTEIRTYMTGGVMLAYSNCLVTIDNTMFTDNSGLKGLQGVILSITSNVTINRCMFVANKGSVLDVEESNLTDYNSVYRYNLGREGSALYSNYSSVKYVSCLFQYNHSPYSGGVIQAYMSTIALTKSHLRNNSAIYGGAMTMNFCNVSIDESMFSNNTATIGSAIRVSAGRIIINRTLFYKNSAEDTGTMFVEGCDIYITSVVFAKNTANILNTVYSKGMIYIVDSTLHTSEQLLILGNSAAGTSIVYIDKSVCDFINRFTFSNNSGSFLIVNSWILFRAQIKFLNCYYMNGNFTVQMGGALTTIESTVYFIGNTIFIGNHAKMHGGAMHATGSTIHLIGKTKFENNFANASGGGVYLFQSKLNCVDNCTFFGNTAKKFGGAIYAISSTIYANDEQVRRPIGPLANGQMPDHFVDYSSTTFIFSSNKAQMGGALAFEMNSKIYGSSSYKIIFTLNFADYGGAVFVNDYTNSGTCASTSYITHSGSTECFIQTLNYNKTERLYIDKRHYQFLDNFAAKSGPTLYGGLLDRCTVSPVTDLMFLYLDNVTSSVTITPVKQTRVMRKLRRM